MPKQNLSTVVTSKFKTTGRAERKAAFTRQMARWINGMEKKKDPGKP